MKRTRAGRSKRRNGAFTLIETALASIIIGVGVVAIIEAQQTFMKNNEWSSHAAAATYLAGELREMTRNIPRHDPVTGLSILDAAYGGSSLVGWGPEPGEVEPSDFDDLDDFDGLRFGIDGDFEGPIDAFGEVITDTDANGMTVLDDDGNPMPMRGWFQSVIVEKVDPRDFSVVRDDNAVDPPTSGFKGRDVDEFPLRVTVVVEYQGLYDTSPTEVARVTWVVP